MWFEVRKQSEISLGDEEWLANCLLYFALSRWEGWFLVDFGTNVELIEATFTGLWAALASLQSRTFLWRCQTKMHSKLNMCVCGRVWMWSIYKVICSYLSPLTPSPPLLRSHLRSCLLLWNWYHSNSMFKTSFHYLFISFFTLRQLQNFFFWCWVSEKIYRFHPSQLQLKVLGWSVSSYFLSLHSLHSKYIPPAQLACLGVMVIISKLHMFFFFFFLMLERHFYSCSSLTRQILVISLEQKNKKEKGSVNIMSGQIKYQAWVLTTLFSCFVTG